MTKALVWTQPPLRLAVAAMRRVCSPGAAAGSGVAAPQVNRAKQRALSVSLLADAPPDRGAEELRRLRAEVRRLRAKNDGLRAENDGLRAAAAAAAGERGAGDVEGGAGGPASGASSGLGGGGDTTHSGLSRGSDSGSSLGTGRLWSLDLVAHSEADFAVLYGTVKVLLLDIAAASGSERGVGEADLEAGC